MKNLSLHLIFSICFSAFICHEANGQKYNWDQVDIKLLSGQTMSGQLMNATKDSLFMLDRNRPFAGCAVTITAKHKELTMKGTVKVINKSTIIISTEAAPYEMLIYRNQVKSIKVTSSPESAQRDALQAIAYGYRELDYVGIHKIGAGGIGAGVGGGIGALIGGAIGASQTYQAPPSSNTSLLSFLANGLQSNPPSESKSGLGGGLLLGGLVGASLGALVATSNKKHYIKGDPEKFGLFVERISR